MQLNNKSLFTNCKTRAACTLKYCVQGIFKYISAIDLVDMYICCKTRAVLWNTVCKVYLSIFQPQTLFICVLVVKHVLYPKILCTMYI